MKSNTYADAGEYVIGGVTEKTLVGVGKTTKRVMSVGANPKRPGLFYFAIDNRFENFPGFGCVWPSPDEVKSVSSVPVREAPGKVEGDE